MIASTAVPVEEYLRTTYDPDMEYVGGQLVGRNVGEYDHSRLQSLLVIELGARERERRFRVFTEQRVRVSDEPRYRTPDLCAKALPHEKAPILIRPDLVIEILSPDDKPAEVLEKIADYQAAGIPHIWVADPYQRTVIEADQSGLRRSVALKLSTPLVGEVNFGLLFQQLAEPPE
jgi:Uma2 family endonuclease